jgi:hypothetical protein
MPLAKSVEELNGNLDYAIEARLNFEYQHGLEDGLSENGIPTGKAVVSSVQTVMSLYELIQNIISV